MPDAPVTGEIGVGAGDHARFDAMSTRAAPLQRFGGGAAPQFDHFMHHYSLLLLPVALVIALNPRATLRLAARLWAGWVAWQDLGGPPEARLVGALKQVLRRDH
jgi:hypothetical protein